MAAKDLNANENIDRDKKTKENWEPHHTTGKRYPEEAKGIGEPDIKNAHATGDGSFGRNDESVPEREEKEKKNDNNY